MIYLDNAATSFPKPESVYVAMDNANRSIAVNAGRGSYKVARNASSVIREARVAVAQLLKVRSGDDVIFTSSATQALNIVLRGLEYNTSTVVYESPYEHNAVARTIHSIQKRTNCSVKIMPLSPDLRIDMEKLRYDFGMNKPDIVVCTAISNVTGLILPFMDIFSEAKRYGAVTILDASQAAGLIPIDMQKSNADIICFAGHKTLCGPFGIAGFTKSNSIDLGVTVTGGTGSDSLNLEMPSSGPGRYEAGSPDVTVMAGLLAALKEVDQAEHYKKIRSMTTYLIDRLKDIPKVRLMGSYDGNDCIGIVSFVVEGYTSGDVGEILDNEFDIAVRTGYHCAPFIHRYIGSESYRGTIRVGLGLFNTEDDINRLAEALRSL